MELETWKRVQNLQVVTLAEGAIVGRLEDFQFDLESRRIYGWRLKLPGVFSTVGLVRADLLTLVGRDVAFVSSLEAVEVSGDKKVARSKGRAWASQYVGVSVVTRRGGSLGGVQDYVIDRHGGEITGLILHGERLLPLRESVNTSAAAVIVPDEGLVVDLPTSGEDADEVSFWRRMRDSLGGPGKKRKAPTAELPEGEAEEPS